VARTPKEYAFTDDRIEGLAVPRKRTEFRDTITPGLRLRVGTSGARTFIAYGRDEDGAFGMTTLGRWTRDGLGGTLNVAAARLKLVGLRGEKKGLGNATVSVGDLLDQFIERGKPSPYTASVLRKHLAPVRHATAATISPAALSDLVAKVLAGYHDEDGRKVGGPAVADKVRGGLCTLFAWAQRQGKFPDDKPLPTRGLVRQDFGGIGWKPRERVPSERELHQLLDALGVGKGANLEVDLTVSPRISLAARLAVLLLMHVPVRTAAVLAQPTNAADLDAGVLRWRTRKGRRDEALEAPLSSVVAGRGR
jgi:hypothetical protein